MKLLIILPVLFEAISEGLYLRGERAGGPFKLISKQVQVLLIASWFLIILMFAKDAINGFTPLLRLWGNYIILYFLARVALFNYIHNLAAWPAIKAKLDALYKRPAKPREVIFYVGTVSFTDRIVAIVSFGSVWMILTFQVICVILFTLLILNRL